MESIDIATKLIGGLATIFGIALTLSHLLAQKSTGKIKKYEIYKELKSHFDDSPEKNFPLMCVALDCLIDRKLTLDESKWFITTPHAFKYLKAYSDQSKYIEISEKKDCFVYKNKYSSKLSRLLEYVQYLTIYIILASLGIISITLTNINSEHLSTSLIGYVLGGILILLGIMALLQNGHLRDTKSTTKHKFFPLRNIN